MMTIIVGVMTEVMTVAFSSQFCMHEQEFDPMYHFSESPKRAWGHSTGSLVDRLL